MGTFTIGVDNAADSTGWSSYSGTPAGAIYFVDPSAGNDTYDGLHPSFVSGSQGPFATVVKAINTLNALLGTGGSGEYWILIREGTAHAPSATMFPSCNGLSATQPIIVSSYDVASFNPAAPVFNPAVGARPILAIDSTAVLIGFKTQGGGAPGANGGNYWAFIGIDFYNSDADPGNTATVSPHYNSANLSRTNATSAVNFLNSTDWILFEDCVSRFFVTGLSFTNNAYTGTPKAIIRRTQIRDCYGNISSGASNICVGLYTSTYNAGVAITESLFDHNGWLEGSSPGVGNGPWDENHNYYIADYVAAYADGGAHTTSLLTPATLTNNIFARDAASSQTRSGGTIDNNLWARSPIPHNIGAPGAASTVQNNVYTESLTRDGTMQGQAGGIMGASYRGDSGNNSTVTFGSNIAANAIASVKSLSNANGGFTATFDNNITFNYAAPSFATGGVLTGTITNAGSGGTPGTYRAALIGGTGTGAYAYFVVGAGGTVTSCNVTAYANPTYVSGDANGVTFSSNYTPGSGYAVNDILGATAANIGNVSGFQFTVNSVAVNTETNAKTDTAGTNTFSFSDPYRTVGSYYATLVGATSDATFTGVIDAGGVLTVSGITGTIYENAAIIFSGQANSVVVQNYGTGSTTGTGANGTYKVLGAASVTSRAMTAYGTIQFLTDARAKQRKGTWDVNYTANAVNNYVRSGFGVAAIVYGISHHGGRKLAKF